MIVRAQENNMREQREDFTLTLAVNSDSTYKLNVKKSLFLNGPNVLQLYPSEKVFLEIEQLDGKILSIKSVVENKYPQKTIEISFAQIGNSQNNSGMMLKINNPFELNLRYSAKIYLLKENKWIKTNVLPVKANLSSFETWTDVIVSIALSDWALVK